MKTVLIATFVLTTFCPALLAQQKLPVGFPQIVTQQPPPQASLQVPVLNPPPAIVFDPYGRPLNLKHDIYGRPLNVDGSPLPPVITSSAIKLFYDHYRSGPFSLDLSKLKKIDKAPARTGNEQVYKLRHPSISCGTDYEICHDPTSRSYVVTVSGLGIRGAYVPKLAVGATRVVNRTEFVNGVEMQVAGTQWFGGDFQWHGKLQRRATAKPTKEDQKSPDQEAKPAPNQGGG